MGKASRVKVELMEARDLLDLLQVLKDIADMRYHSLLAAKDQFLRFSESFVDFFRLVGFTTVQHPLVSNSNPKLGIVVITSEQGFVGDMNAKVINRALQEKEQEPNVSFITVGRKGTAKLEGMGIKIQKSFEEIDEVGMYETSVQLKNYLVEQVMKGELGRVVVLYPWPKDFMTIKPKVIKLLPCEDVLMKQSQTVEKFQYVIEESDPLDIIGYLADIWLSSRLYELLYDTSMAAAAAQSQQLDNSLGKMRKENLTVKLKYRKARRNDIDKSLRETFSARMLATK